jgi:hypothetical protein
MPELFGVSGGGLCPQQPPIDAAHQIPDPGEDAWWNVNTAMNIPDSQAAEAIFRITR